MHLLCMSSSRIGHAIYAMRLAWLQRFHSLCDHAMTTHRYLLLWARDKPWPWSLTSIRAFSVHSKMAYTV